MHNMLIPIFSALLAGFRFRLVLPNRIIVLIRSVNRPKLRPWDRFLRIWLLRLWPERQSALVIVKPETVISWLLFRPYCADLGESQELSLCQEIVYIGGCRFYGVFDRGSPILAPKNHNGARDSCAGEKTRGAGLKLQSTREQPGT
jgi:hypothetical protein